MRSNRPATDPYDGPITTTWTLGEQSGTFGSDLQDDFSGLPGLLEVSFTDAAGDPVGRTRPVTACLNGDSERIQPEGAASNAYPWGCPYNPYTLGSVQGVQDGYATRLWAGARTRLAVGSYTATIAVGDRYADRVGPRPRGVARRRAADRPQGRRPRPRLADGLARPAGPGPARTGRAPGRRARDPRRPSPRRAPRPTCPRAPRCPTCARCRPSRSA